MTTGFVLPRSIGRTHKPTSKQRHTMRFVLFGNTYQTKKSTHIQQLLATLRRMKNEVYIDASFYNFVKQELELQFEPDGIFEDGDFEADMAISMGGDGTFLKTASRIGNKNIPILGVNTGRLGFLADVSPEEIDKAFADILHGCYHIEERKVLQLSCEPQNFKGYPFALNEVSVLKRDTSSMISIRTQVNGQYLTTYQADGLIVATPTGSTAYSLSVGGPIMIPQSGILAITAVAPHNLNIRPIVVRDDSVITLDIESRSHNFLVSVDGRSESLHEGTRLTIRRAPYTVKLVQQNGHSFINTLREKMMWGADKR